MNVIGKASILVRRIRPHAFIPSKGAMFAFRCFSVRYGIDSQYLIRRRLFSTGFKDEDDFYVGSM